MASLLAQSLRKVLPIINQQTRYSSISPQIGSLLHLLSLSRAVSDFRPLRNQLFINGVIHDEPRIEQFLRRCFHLGDPELALSTFAKIRHPSLLLQNTVLRCLCNEGLFEDVLSVFEKCQISGCPSDNYTFPFVLKACSFLGALKIGEVVHCIVLRTGFGGNVVVGTSLLDLYARCGEMVTARHLFDRIPQPDLVSWNALISGYSLNGYYEEVFEVFKEIIAKGLRPNVSTLASTIPVSTRLGCLHVGKSLHGFAVKFGYFADETLVPALISMYAGNSKLKAVWNLFDSSAGKNVSVWNSMVCAYTQNKKLNEAISMFNQMLQEGMHPNTITFLAIIPSCEDNGCLLCGTSLHACVVKYGSDNQISVMTALLSMYAKHGDIYSAEIFFNEMPGKNILAWNSLISAYVYSNRWDTCLAAFNEMQSSGFYPDAISLIPVLSSCSELEAILPGRSAHAYCTRKGFDANLSLCNALLAFYCRCCHISSAYKLFEKMAARNIISWNTLISAHVYNKEPENAVALLHEMQQKGVEFDSVTLLSILPCCDGPQKLVQGMTIHGHAMKVGLNSDISLANAIISMYLNCGKVDDGKSVFDGMFHRNVVSWNALITGYRNQNLMHDAIMLFSEMSKEDQKPNYVTLLNIIPACQTLVQGKSIHCYAAKIGIVLESTILTSLMLMYAKFREVNSSILLFEEGDKMKISLWNAIISAHVQTNNSKMAIVIFSQLLEKGTGPDYMTLLSLISACAQMKDLNLCSSVMAYVIQKGFENDLAISNALIDMYARCGSILVARKLFEGLREKDTISWSVMINGHGLHGDVEAVLALVSDMELSGTKPDEITYVSILSACSHAGLVEQGQSFFNTMVESGISPRMEHYACMVDLLGRTGHVQEAYNIVKNLPCKPSLSLLESLLGACISHGEFKLGEEIGILLLQMDPHNPGSYVMLYHVYAEAGRWTDANNIRSQMEEMGLRKFPASSHVVGS